MNRSHAPSYDLFKLIVALMLLLIFLFLLFWMRPSQTRQADDLFIITFTASPAAQAPSTTLRPSPTVVSSPHGVPASITSPPLTETPAPTPTPEPGPSQTPTVVPSPTETPEPTASPTPTALPSPTETPTAEASPETALCEPVSRAPLQIGTQATIVRYLNFRSSPGISNNLILTNAPGTRVEIIGGPECTQYQGGGTYLWWQIRLPDGQEGWSAEASAYGTFYFMEPVR